MKIAIRSSTVLVDADGRVAGHTAGATLVRRLLRVFPGAELIGDEARRCAGFNMLPLACVNGQDTVIINMDVIDSVGVWQALRATCERPKIMNFVWWTTSQYVQREERAALGLSCALFPTFANSERTATEIREIVGSWTIPPLAEKARIGWVNLGIRLEHVQERQEPQIPTVLYPAIYVSDRKQPAVFLDVVERVAKRTPINVEVHLVESHLVSERAMQFSRHNWFWVGPLTASRKDYWDNLAHTTAFLATATDESYGLEYIEALVAGAVGVFPNRPWARAILPEEYPYFYDTPAEAEELLFRAVTDTPACRQELDAAAGGSFSEWLRSRHDDDAFDSAIVAHVERWFGEQ